MRGSARYIEWAASECDHTGERVVAGSGRRAAAASAPECKDQQDDGGDRRNGAQEHVDDQARLRLIRPTEGTARDAGHQFARGNAKAAAIRRGEARRVALARGVSAASVVPCAAGSDRCPVEIRTTTASATTERTLTPRPKMANDRADGPVAPADVSARSGGKACVGWKGVSTAMAAFRVEITPIFVCG